MKLLLLGLFLLLTACGQGLVADGSVSLASVGGDSNSPNADNDKPPVETLPAEQKLNIHSIKINGSARSGSAVLGLDYGPKSIVQ